jgi:serine/threonine-protein kinase
VTEEAIQTGRVLGGKYTLAERLGAGGWGSVYAAMQNDLGRKVAIKVLHTSVALAPDGLARFEREAKAAAALGHPNIAQVTDFQANPGEPPFLVLEYLTGSTLGSIMRTERKIAQARMAWIAYQMLAGLEVAHRAGIVHRDIKPDNVFLVAMAGVEDLVKLLDFGIAKLSGDTNAHLTSTGTMLGSPAFMAPEQVRTPHVDHRVDLYAVGATMYLALSGRMPFNAETVHALLLAITQEQPPPLHTIEPTVDPALSLVIMRAMHKDPEGRFASAGDMRAALEPWLGGMAAHASSTAHVSHGAAAPPTVAGGPPVMSNAGPPIGSPPPGSYPPGQKGPPPGSYPPTPQVGTPQTYANYGPPPQFGAPPTNANFGGPPPPMPPAPHQAAVTPSPVVAPAVAAAPAPAPTKGGGAVIGLLVVVVLLLLIVVGGGGYYMYSRSDAPSQSVASAPSGGASSTTVGAAGAAAAPTTGASGAPAAPGAAGAAGAARGKPAAAGAPGAPTVAASAAPGAPTAVAAPPSVAAAPKKQFAGTQFSINGGQFGEYDIAASKAAIMAHGGAIGACYSQTELDPPDHQFTDWTFQVDPAGNVKGVGRTTSFEPHPKFDACMISALRSVKWPASKAGGSPHVSFSARTRDNP